MLVYDIDTRSASVTTTELNPYEWWISKDRTHMGFTVDSNIGVLNGDIIRISDEASDERRDFIVTAATVRRQGYITYPNRYDLSCDDNGDRGILFSDGVWRYVVDDTVEINGKRYDSSDGYVTVEEKLWVEDGYVEIEGDRIEVDTDLVPTNDGKHKAQTIGYGGVEYQWYGYEPSEWFYVTKVSFESNGWENVAIDGATCGRMMPYIFHDGGIKRISVKIAEDSESGENVEKYYVGDDMVECELERNLEFGNERVVIDGDSYAVEYELMATKHGAIVMLYADGANNVRVDDELYVNCLGNGLEEFDVSTDEDGMDYIIRYGRRHDKENSTWDFVTVGDKEYEVEYEDNDKETFKIDLDGSEARFRIDGENARRVVVSATNFMDDVHYGESEYEIIRKEYFVIDGNRYAVTEKTRIADGDTEDKVRTVEAPSAGSYRLAVTSIYDPNILKCEIRTDRLTDDEYEYECEEAVRCINTSNWHISVRRLDGLFSAEKIEDGNDVYGSQFDRLKAVKVNDYFNIQIPLSVDFSENIFQEDLVGNRYVDSVVDSMMNKQIDLEKDIYYPVLGNGEDVSKIVVSMHFRTRDDDWNIIPDGTWNVYDKYVTPPKYASTNTEKSDLMCFLNFKNTDVYYQKSKVAKSFLRISVYDSVDHETQNLLCMGTAFMDENRLFRRMMDSNGNGQFRAYWDTSDHPQYGNTSTVFSENKESNNDDYRLDATIEIEGRDGTDTSAEGFYWYIFRETGTYMEERTLYMKVDFCHAGEGKSFPMVYKKKDTNIDEFKAGYRLSEVYDALYIPVSAKYDFNKKRYTYRLPSDMENKGQRQYTLNMFELKIMDES